MEEFHYLVVNAEGKQQKYHISGRDENSARYELKKRGITVIKKLSLSSSDRLADVFRPAGRFNLLEFNNQLTPLLEGAIPLAKALEIMEKYPSNERNLNIVHIIRQGLHDGKSFSTLLQEHPDEFPVLYSAMIESGEQSGNLTTVTGELS
ncbi:MAG: type II secretion system F family protein, partial [Victivallaceae bacterium]